MESDLRDVVNMSAIVSGLVEELPGNDKESNKLAFAVYHLERMLQQMEERYDDVLTFFARKED